MPNKTTKLRPVQTLKLEARLRGHKKSKLQLEGEGASALGAWFLGPKAENAVLLQDLVKQAVDRHCQDRRDYFEQDPIWLTEERKDSPSYKKSVELLRDSFSDLLDELEGSVPFFSHRYQGHMLWDVTLPSVAGYFAALLYNQNNVAAEASPVTTWLEMLVGDDLCRMLGYHVPKRKEDGTYEEADGTIAWGHITCDGSVANTEAVWAARNLKFIPLGIAAALRSVPALAPGRGLAVRLPSGDERVLVELSTWELFNLPIDEVLQLESRLKNSYTYEPEVDVAAILSRYKVENAGLSAFMRRHAPTSQDPVLVTPATAHYSWPKAMSLLGLGRDSTIRVQVNLDARLDMNDLRRKLDACLRDQKPIIAVVAVLGTTEESAVDPLAELLEERERYRKLGLEFWIHVDAAWGGYFASMLRSSEDGPIEAEPENGRARILEQQFTAALVEDPHEVLFGPHLVMSAYVRRQYAVLGKSDSITVDPHKAGYIPYPAGGLCYRDAAMRNLVAFAAPVVYHGGIDPTVGVYGVEGSKPGAAAAAVYLSHRVIRTDKTGYGRILGRCIWNSKRLYCALVSMASADDPFRIKAFQRLPSERVEQPVPEAIEAELERIRTEIVPRSNRELLEALNCSPELLSWFETLGSDQVIVSYAFNFVRKNAELNTNAQAMNDLNQEIFRRLSLGSREDGIPDVPLFVTASNFDPAVYGTHLVHSFQRRLGVDPCDIPLDFLLSTTMNPWLTDTAEGNFIPTLIEEFRKTLLNILENDERFH